MKTLFLKMLPLCLMLVVSSRFYHVQAQDHAKVTDTDNGFSYMLPPGWNRTSAENGAVSYTKGGDNGNIIIVSPHAFTSIDDVMRESNQPQQLGELTLTLQNSPQAFGSNGVLAQYAGMTQGNIIHLLAITMVSPHSGGGGALVAGISVGDTPNEGMLMACQSLANSVKFAKPQTSALATQWTQALRGKQLLYLKTSNGLSEKSSYDLCSDGSFYYSSDESYSSNTFTDSFNSNIAGNGHGTWKIITQGQQVMILFSFKNGTTRQFEITTDADYLYLNRVKYFRQAAQNCE